MRCAEPSHAGPSRSGSLPYIHSAEKSWNSAHRTAALASQTFIVIVSLKPSVIDRSLAGSWTLP